MHILTFTHPEIHTPTHLHTFIQIHAITWIHMTADNNFLIAWTIILVGGDCHVF